MKKKWFCSQILCRSQDPQNARFCPACQFKKYRLYNETEVGFGGSPCGGVRIWKVTPQKSSTQLRCHHVFQGLFVLHPDSGLALCSFEQLNDWETLWDWCQNWHTTFDGGSEGFWPGIDTTKYSGQLKRGIVKRNGNGIHAAVQDQTGQIYRITGGWG